MYSGGAGRGQGYLEAQLFTGPVTCQELGTWRVMWLGRLPRIAINFQWTRVVLAPALAGGFGPVFQLSPLAAPCPMSAGASSGRSGGWVCCLSVWVPAPASPARQLSSRGGLVHQFSADDHSTACLPACLDISNNAVSRRPEHPRRTSCAPSVSPAASVSTGRTSSAPPSIVIRVRR